MAKQETRNASRDMAMEDELREQIAQYRGMFESSLDAILVADLNGYIAEVNPAACELYGYSKEEFVGLHASAILHPDSAHVLAEAMKNIKAGKAFWSHSINLRKDGSIFHGEGRTTSFTYRGQPHALAMIRDISAWVKAEEQLRQREEQYRGIFESTTDGLEIADMNGIIVAANSALCRMYGYTWEEMIGLNVGSLVAPESQGLLKEYGDTISRGESFEVQAVDLKKDGTLFHVEVHAAPFNYGGKPHVLAAVRDVTDRVRAEEQLREREEQYRSIFEATGDGLIIVNMNADIVEANSAFCRMFGYTYDEVIGVSITALSHPDYLDLINEGMRTIDAGGTHYSQAPAIHKDGTIFHTEARASTFTYKSMPHVLAVVRDVTARVKTEQAIQEERQRLSRELHDSVSQALYSIALGARTARTLLDSDPRRAVDPLEFTLTQAEAGLAEMRALIFELRPEALEQQGLAAALEKQAHAQGVRHQVRVETFLCAEPAIPLKSKEALYRIAQEAMHNAFKHAQPKSLTVRLDRTEDELVLEVRDDGAGFDPAGSFPGHLGLRSMEERAVRLGGSLHVESAPGEGTRLRAHIPSRSTA